MRGQGGGYRKLLAVAGVLAAIAFIARGVLDLRHGSGGALILVGVVVLAAVALRQFLYRD